MSVFSLIAGMLGLFGEKEDIVHPAKVYIGYCIIYHWVIVIIGIGAILCAFCFFVNRISDISQRKNLLERTWFYLLTALLLWAMLSTALSDEPFDWASGRDLYIFDNIFTYFIYAACFIFGSVLLSEKYRIGFLRLFVIVNTYLSLILYGQISGNAFIRYCFPTIGAAVFTNTNYFAYVLCMSIAALAGLYLFDEAAGKIRKTLYMLGFVFQLTALIINNTFGCYLAVIAALPFFYICYFRSGKKHRLWIWLPVVLFLLISVLDYFGWLPAVPSAVEKEETILQKNFLQLIKDFMKIILGQEGAEHSGSGRWALWTAAIERIKERPIFGYGPEGFDDVTKFVPYGSPHNDILQIAAYLGIPALIFYLAALFTLARHLWKSMKELSPTTLAVSGVVVCYLASSMFGHPVYNTTPFFWMFLGMITLKNEQDEPLFSGSKVEKAVKKEWIVLISLVLFCALCILIGAVRSAPGNEKPKEYADLQAMRCAEVTAMGVLKREEIDTVTEYWYDVNEFRLIPLGEEPMKAMGKGTKKSGGGLEQYLSEGNPAYEYDEALDYTDKAIRVTVDPGTGEISVFWVETEGS